MKDPRDMTVEELKEFIEIFPKNSVCERAKVEKLMELLEDKVNEMFNKLIVENSNICV